MKLSYQRNMKKYNAICLSGGAEKGFIEIGVLHHYVETGELSLDNVTKYAGTSIGSVICLMLICGYKPVDVFTKMYCKEGLLKVEVGGNSLKDVLNKKGLLPIEHFTDLPKEFVLEKLGYIPTLKQLYDLTKKEFYIVVGDVTAMCKRVLSYHTDPDLDVISAIGYSSGLPGLFHQQYYKGHLLVDGGLVDNFPIMSIYTPEDEILAIVVMTREMPNIKPDKIMGYVYRLALLSTNANTSIRCEYTADNLTVINVEWKSDDVLTIGLPTKEKMRMFLRGIQAAEYHSSIKKIHVDGYYH